MCKQNIVNDLSQSQFLVDESWKSLAFAHALQFILEMVLGDVGWGFPYRVTQSLFL